MQFAKSTNALCAALIALSACGPVPSAGGLDADRRVVISNETGQTIQEFYGSRATTQNWEENILDGDVLRNGDRILINFDDGSDDCIFDMKAELGNGKEMVKPGIDVCRVEVVTFN